MSELLDRIKSYVEYSNKVLSEYNNIKSPKYEVTTDKNEAKNVPAYCTSCDGYNFRLNYDLDVIRNEFSEYVKLIAIHEVCHMWSWYIHKLKGESTKEHIAGGHNHLFIKFINLFKNEFSNMEWNMHIMRHCSQLSTIPEFFDMNFSEGVKMVSSKTIGEIINSLIADEYLAWRQYYMARIVAKGRGLNFFDKVADTNAKDELDDHLNRLVTWAQSNEIPVLVNYEDMVKNCNCPYENMRDDTDTTDLVDILLKAEECAIEAYLRYSKIVKDEYPDLSMIMLELCEEEREHKKDLLDLKSAVSKEPSITLQFSKKLEELGRITSNFSNKDWSDKVDTEWTPKDDLFAKGSPKEISKEVCKNHKDLRSSMSSINFYINRAGKNLPKERKEVLVKAKELIRDNFKSNR